MIQFASRSVFIDTIEVLGHLDNSDLARTTDVKCIPRQSDGSLVAYQTCMTILALAN
jgi:hypothetical protein